MAKVLTGVLGLSPSPHPVVQFIRYGMVAVCGYLLAILLYSGELELGITPYLALGIAFVLNGLFNFALIRTWAFPPSGRTATSDLVRFCVAAGVSLVVNYSSFAVLYSGIGLGAEASQRIAILIAAPVTFMVNRLWSFRASQVGVPEPFARPSSASLRKES
jgi:putative flippase GtrA